LYTALNLRGYLRGPVVQSFFRKWCTVPWELEDILTRRTLPLF